MLDTAGEAKLGKLEIGTTKRGIGPCYADKSARLGIRVQDLLDAKILRKKIAAALEPKQQLLRPFARDPKLDLHTMTEEYLRYGHRLEPHIADTSRLCWEALDAGQTVLFEGAQAALLDLDHGTYPFVTSSNPVAGRGLRRRRRRPDRHRRGLGRLQGVHDAGRRRPVPDRAHRRGRRPPARPGPRVRDDHRARAPLRLARPGRAALRDPAQPAVGAGDHEARRAHRARPAAGCGPLPRQRGRRVRRVPVPPVDPPHGHGRVRGPARLGGGHQRRAQPADLPPTPATTSTRSPRAPVFRSPWSGSDPGASR